MAPPGRDWLRMLSHFGHQRQKLWLRDFDLAAHSRENKRGSHSAPRPHQSNRGLTRSLLTPASHHRKPCVFCKATSDTFRLRLELPFRLVPVPFGKKGIALRVYLPTLVKDPSGVGRIPISIPSTASVEAKEENRLVAPQEPVGVGSGPDDVLIRVSSDSRRTSCSVMTVPSGFWRFYLGTDWTDMFSGDRSC